MSRKLFSKLQSNNFSDKSEQVAHSSVNNIIEKVNEVIANKFIKKITPEFITSEIMHKQMYSIDQLYMSTPCSPRMIEDNPIVS